MKNLELNIFKQIVEQSPNSIVITNKDGNIEYVNKVFLKTTGYSYDEVINQNPRILNAGTQPKAFYSKMWETISNGKTWQGKFHNKKKNGELYLEKVKISPITNKNGEITHYVGIKDDITKQEENEERLNSFLNTVPDIICYKNGQGRWLLANKADLELFCLTEVDYFGKTDAELAHYTDSIYKESFLACMTTDEKAWKKKTISHEIETIPMLNGTEKVYDVFKIPSFYPNGERKGLAVIGRDITELKEKEKSLIKLKQKAEESNQLKTEFLHNMSHEIRTPLNGILGFSELLKEENIGKEEQKQYIDVIQNSGKQLLHIIDDILEIARLETRQVSVIEKEVNLNNLLREQFLIFDIKAKEKKLPLYFKKSLADKGSIILTDKTKLSKIVSNLLENAMKFTSTGFIELGYSLVNNILDIYVKDTGVGIKPENQEIIFERFSQEEKALSRNVGGLGLGLSIVKENAELLGGKVSVQSEKEKGSTFHIFIPYKPAKKDSAYLTENDEPPEKKQKVYTILIVEDEEVNIFYIETLLKFYKEISYKVLQAHNGREAVEICKNTSDIDIVLMDLKMPVMNGFEATERIREFRSNLPIIAQTAYSTSKDKNKALASGCNEFISKPIKKEDLKKLIYKHLNIGKII